MCPACGLQVNAPAGGPPATPPATAAPAHAAIQPPPPPYAPTPRSGVGGWLLFFCISFTILWPLWQLSQYAFYHFPFRGPFAWLGPLRLVFGIVVGAVLWTGKPVAMQLLRIYFIFAGALTLWSLFNWFRIIVRMHYNPLLSSSFIFGLGSSVAFLVCAVLYFSMSERVGATYGSKLL
jgi:hypothetical protein